MERAPERKFALQAHLVDPITGPITLLLIGTASGTLGHRMFHVREELNVLSELWL